MRLFRLLTGICVLTAWLVATAMPGIAAAKDKNASKAADRLLAKVEHWTPADQHAFYLGLSVALQGKDQADAALAKVPADSAAAQGMRFGRGIALGVIKLSGQQRDYLGGTLKGQGMTVSGNALPATSSSAAYEAGVRRGVLITQQAPHGTSTTTAGGPRGPMGSPGDVPTGTTTGSTQPTTTSQGGAGGPAGGVTTGGPLGNRGSTLGSPTGDANGGSTGPIAGGGGAAGNGGLGSPIGNPAGGGSGASGGLGNPVGNPNNGSGAGGGGGLPGTGGGSTPIGNPTNPTNPTNNPTLPNGGYNDGYQAGKAAAEKAARQASGMARANAGLGCAEGLFGAYVAHQAATVSAETAGTSAGIGSILGPASQVASQVPNCYTALTGQYPEGDWMYALGAAGGAYRLYDLWNKMKQINEAKKKQQQQGVQTTLPPGTVLTDQSGKPVGVVGQDGRVQPVGNTVPVVASGGVIPNGSQVVLPSGLPVPASVPAVGGGGGQQPARQANGTTGDATQLSRAVQVLCNDWDFNCIWRTTDVVTAEEFQNLTNGLDPNNPKDEFVRGCATAYPGNPPPEWWISMCGSRALSGQLPSNPLDARSAGIQAAKQTRERIGSFVGGVLQGYTGPQTVEGQRAFFDRIWRGDDGKLSQVAQAVINGGLTPQGAGDLGLRTANADLLERQNTLGKEINDLVADGPPETPEQTQAVNGKIKEYNDVAGRLGKPQMLQYAEGLQPAGMTADQRQATTSRMDALQSEIKQMSEGPVLAPQAEAINKKIDEYNGLADQVGEPSMVHMPVAPTWKI